MEAGDYFVVLANPYYKDTKNNYIGRVYVTLKKDEENLGSNKVVEFYGTTNPNNMYFGE